MPKAETRPFIVLGCLAALAFGRVAIAQDKNEGTPYYEGYTPNSAGCPTISYVILRISSSPVGYVWFSDASGMSKATGTMDTSTGHFHLTLKSVDGKGPTGEVVGIKDPHDGTVTAELDGPGCSKLKLLPMTPMYQRKGVKPA